MSEEPKTKAYTNEPFLKSEHLKRDGNYVAPKLIVKNVLTGVPLMRKGKPYAGLAIVFEGQEKVLGLNATNESMMAVSTGDSQSSKWIGATITLEVREVNSVAGGTEPAIRIMPPNGTKMRSGLAKQLGKRIEPVNQATKDAAK
jgi:hypothetical protein